MSSSPPKRLILAPFLTDDMGYHHILGSSYPLIGSKDWKSKKVQKRLAEEHPKYYEETYGKAKMLKQSLRRVPLSYHNKRIPLRKEEVRRCVETSLSSWNQKSVSEKGPMYELVEELGCLSIRLPAIYHCNFIARPKDSTENKLFFAELKHDYDTGYVPGTTTGPPPLRCLFCCILGSPGTKTGLCGCTICDWEPGLVQHPEQGGFQKKGKVPFLGNLTPEEAHNYICAEKYSSPGLAWPVKF